MSSLMTLMPTTFFSGDQIEKVETGGACSAYEAELYTEFYVEF